MSKTVCGISCGGALLACLSLAACGNENQLTLDGTYSGTSESSCSVGVYDAGTFKLVESHSGGPNFSNLEYSVDKGRYYVEVHCGDGKYGSSPPFDFQPPRARIALRNIELH